MSAAVSLEDVQDVHAFAAWRARKVLGANGHLTQAQHEDAAEEAVVLIFELHSGYAICEKCWLREANCDCPEPRLRQITGWDPSRCARFSAYLLSKLDRALIDWWRREIRQSGRGRWSGSELAYRYNGMTSLDIETQITDSALIVHAPEI